MKLKFFNGFVTLLLAAAFFSCKEDNLGKLRQRELEKLDTYIINNYPELEPKRSGLFFIEQQEGVGDSINVGDRVQIFYDIWTLDSVYIDGSGSYEPLQIDVQPASQLSASPTSVRNLKGLNEALTYMKKDSKALLILPSQLAFGQNGLIGGGVPGFTTLLMEVKVYKVYPAQTQ